MRTKPNYRGAFKSIAARCAGPLIASAIYLVVVSFLASVARS